MHISKHKVFSPALSGDFDKPLTYYLGSFLIAISLIILLVIYLPVLRAYLPATDKSALATSPYTINIPKINANAPIIDNVDPWNESQYREALKKGVDRKSTRLNSSHSAKSRMPSSA